MFQKGTLPFWLLYAPLYFLFMRQEAKSKNRLPRWGVDIQVHFVNWCPSIRVTVLLVFILLHCSRSSGRYLAATYHAEEFTQNHTDMTQPQLLTALNWTIRTACSIIIFVLVLIIIINMLVVIAVSVFSMSGHCLQYFVHYVLCCPNVPGVSSAVFKCDELWRAYTNSHLWLQLFIPDRGFFSLTHSSQMIRKPQETQGCTELDVQYTIGPEVANRCVFSLYMISGIHSCTSSARACEALFVLLLFVCSTRGMVLKAQECPRIFFFRISGSCVFFGGRRLLVLNAWVNLHLFASLRRCISCLCEDIRLLSGWLLFPESTSDLAKMTPSMRKFLFC